MVNNSHVDFNVWDIVEFKFNGKLTKGTILPTSESIYLDVVVIKLTSGYNAGFKISELVDLKVIGKQEQTSFNSVKYSNFVKSSDLIDISLVHTGGTIASRVDYTTGGVVSQFSPSEIIALYPELTSIANINSVILGNISSENITLSQINALAKLIESEINKGAKGIVITHGTDTLHYTSAALHYMLSGLKVPVVLVGSQRSSDRPSSDARMNLVSAFEFIKQKSDLLGVYICMHAGLNDDFCHILSGLNAKKSHSSIRGAFKPINLGPLFSINYVSGDIIDLRTNFELDFISSNTIAHDNFSVKLFNTSLKVGIVNSYPGFNSDLLKFYLDSNYSGLILNGTGLGHFPIVDDQLIGLKNSDLINTNKSTFEALTTLSKKIPVVMATQTGDGIVNLNVYTPGRMLNNIGILGDQSILTVESNYMKLLFLLSNYSVKELKKFY